MSYRLSIDIGGTFTDSVLLNEETGEIRYWKSPSTPADYSEGVMDSIIKIYTPLDKVGFFTHGTTVGINALIQGKAAQTGLITTKGWRDSIEIGRSNRIEMYDPLYRKPRPLVPRRYRCEVTERLDYKGDTLAKLNKEDVHDAVKIFKYAKLPAVAICLLNSYVNPSHEESIKEIVRASYPGAFISISSDITREYREYERTCTTIINASLMPIISRYLAQLEEKFVGAGYPKGQEIYIMQSNGGIMASKIAKELPVYTVESGQAGG
ncbi:MAG: hydantoinase/oxoprolinase N-terminal domain-containing protein, partial [Promethearchaeota archaeon]